MISVIIPVLNEAATIQNVVRFCLQNKDVTEVIVVDDKSEDDTVNLAREAGANVIISETRGKGISMKDGIRASKNEILIFLDGDIDPYPDNTIADLAAPLINDEADFIKGTFARNAGRVTELVAKPLLTIFYPGLSSFSQPLSGMIAGRKHFFNKIDFFNDYGVDIGILIDMYLMQTRIREVNIGYIENKSKPWQALGKMSNEVSRAIISRAQRRQSGQKALEEMHSVETINSEMNKILRENLSGFHKMVIWDMDDTILKGRFVDECAKAYGFTAKLEDLRDKEKDPIILTKRIALLLKGRSIDELLQVANQIPLVDDIREVVTELKARGYITGIISHSYLLITNFLRQKIGADFSYANQLEYFDGMATGEVNLPSYFFGSPESICGHAYCKTNALQYACEKHNVPLRNCIVVGDNYDDRCIVGHAGKGIAFCSKDELLNTIAFRNIQEPSFKEMLNLA
ncbi:MAG: glycosyltransferase [Chitinophagaceae bacterium]|nr:MAG: glycosyltransferase [Chitinophagaceae bacterium]